ncbi:hypothetical protein [Brevundimonas sp. 2YAF1]|uniref:hypothetical protein n=1 Tax=Brevundimonas sp. 2YAF1 TaxID=3233024 RepID=UPI003F91C6EC
MSVWSREADRPSWRRRGAIWALWCALPLLALGYQIAAEQTARALKHIPFGQAWLVQAAALPWARLLLGLEIASFVAWMVVLSEMKLSAAFPLSAFSYVLVIIASWTLFNEPISLLQVGGGMAILGGVWLIGSGEARP